MLSKILTQALKPALTQSLRNKSINQTVFRAMATSDVASVDRAKQKLDKALSREIKFEEENYRYDQSVSVIGIVYSWSDFFRNFLKKMGLV